MTNAQNTGAATTAAADPKPKAPRRESTRVAAANRIAATHGNPKALLALMGAHGGHERAGLAAMASEIDAAEKALSDKRADLRGRKEFMDEIEGLNPTLLVGVKAILESRAK